MIDIFHWGKKGGGVAIAVYLVLELGNVGFYVNGISMT